MQDQRTHKHFRSVRITANFFNDAGNLVGTDTGTTALASIRPGDKTCFENYATCRSAEQQPFETPIYSFTASPGRHCDLQRAIAQSRPLTPTRSLNMSPNNSVTRVNYAEIVGTIYNDAEFTCWMRGFFFVNSTNLDPGQVSSFSIRYDGHDFLMLPTIGYRLMERRNRSGEIFDGHNIKWVPLAGADCRGGRADQG